MKVTILCHELSSNAVMRAHRLAQAARTFAEVKLIGSVSRKGAWPALPQEPWIRPVRKRRFPRFYETFLALVEAAPRDGDYSSAGRDAVQRVIDAGHAASPDARVGGSGPLNADFIDAVYGWFDRSPWRGGEDSVWVCRQQGV